MQDEEETLYFEDELFFWKSRAIQLETDLADLIGQYEKMKALKEQLEMHILQSEQPKKTKVKKKQSKFQEEFKVFFEQKKKDTQFITDLKNKLIRLEIIEEGETIPWYIVRDECKRVFIKSTQ